MKATPIKRQPKAKVSDATIVNFILDKSGSMESVREATISGFNEYVQTLKKDKKSKYEFTLTLFDTVVKTFVKGVKIENIAHLNREDYAPDGGTALYDAVCSTIKGIKEGKGQKVITIILTDGQENSSKEYSEKEMKVLIEERTKKGNWTFVYMGANQDSYAVAQKYGISRGNTANFNASATGTVNAFYMAASNTSSLSASTEVNAKFFSAKDQTDLENTK